MKASSSVQQARDGSGGTNPERVVREEAGRSKSTDLLVGAKAIAGLWVGIGTRSVNA